MLTNNERRSSKRQDRPVRLRRRHLELCLLEVLAGGHKGHAQYQQQVGKDGAEHGGLYDPELVLLEGDDPDDRFDGVAWAHARTK